MKTETIVMCVVALILGMLIANMLKNVCGCENVVEGGIADSAFNALLDTFILQNTSKPAKTN